MKPNISLALLMALTACGPVAQTRDAVAATLQADEYQAKAVFLFNFAKFVEWPEGTFKSADEKIRICVLGDDPFGPPLVGLVAGKTINDRGIGVLHFYDIKEVGRCQILFVGKSERKQLPAILAAAASNPILTVGESDHFALDGGMIGFRLEDGKVRLEINLQAAERVHVHVSSKLLSLAQVVKK